MTYQCSGVQELPRIFNEPLHQSHQLSLFDARHPVLTEASFTHPQTNREIQLGTHRVGYVLRCTPRRSIGFMVDARGLAVSAPRTLSPQYIDAAVRAKASWILSKLQEQQERARHIDSARLEWRHGTQLPFLGGFLTIVLAGPGITPSLSNNPIAPANTAHQHLFLDLPESAAAQQIRNAAWRWLQRQALLIFTERCQHFAPLLNVQLHRLSLSSARTRWGSACADGSIRLNWRLVHFKMAVLDYVVVHELAHLREMNHSAAFWAIVRSVLPDYLDLRRALKDLPLALLSEY